MIQRENLYQPDKYRVILGEGKTAGFCTLWNEPEKAIEQAPDLLKKSAIVGTLYSRQGVNIILRNLALNPQIRNLYIWNSGTLSCSPFGVSGKDILLKLWESGLEGKIVKGTDFKIENEIDESVVNQIIKNVKLEEITDTDPQAICQKITESENEPYMEPVRFKDSIPEAIDIFPSETLGFVVHGKTILDAWSRVVERIMRYGKVKGTQYGTQQRELIGVTWVIENEDPDNPQREVDWPESLKQTTGLNDESINHYKEVFLSADAPEGVKYTYGNRLMKYPGTSKEVNQISEVILKELKDSKDTRRGVATTLVPEKDGFSKEPPCLTQVQVLQTDNRLHLLATLRSHDIFKAGIPNAYGLRFLQKEISQKAGMELGSLQITSQSAHVYEAEWEDAKKLSECNFWEREPSSKFNPEKDADPRGLFVISTKNNKITAFFKTPSGDDLIEISRDTAKEVYSKIAQLDLIKNPEHMFDIGAELQKAEIAIDTGAEYAQDKPLDLKISPNKNTCHKC